MKEKIEDEIKISPAEILLNKSMYGKELPEGKNGEKIFGFSFYEVQKIRNKETGEVIRVEWEFIGSRMGEAPILSAVTEQQYKNWKKQDIQAIPAEFIWDNEKKIWKVETKVSIPDS